MSTDEELERLKRAAEKDPEDQRAAMEYQRALDRVFKHENAGLPRQIYRQLWDDHMIRAAGPGPEIAKKRERLPADEMALRGVEAGLESIMLLQLTVVTIWTLFALLVWFAISMLAVFTEWVDIAVTDAVGHALIAFTLATSMWFAYKKLQVIERRAESWERSGDT